MTIKAWFEVKKEDCWIGVYWDKGKHNITMRQGNIELSNSDYWVTDVWICFIPCVPLHIQRLQKIAKSE